MVANGCKGFAAVTLPGESFRMSVSASNTNKLLRAGSRSRRSSLLAALAVWSANLLLIGGAVLISVAPATASQPVLFAGFLAGHVCMSLHSYRLRDTGLLTLNIAMALLDLYAVCIRL
jgi:hypothetical protein